MSSSRGHFYGSSLRRKAALRVAGLDDHADAHPLCTGLLPPQEMTPRGKDSISPQPHGLSQGMEGRDFIL